MTDNCPGDVRRLCMRAAVYASADERVLNDSIFMTEVNDLALVLAAISGSERTWCLCLCRSHRIGWIADVALVQL